MSKDPPGVTANKAAVKAKTTAAAVTVTATALSDTPKILKELVETMEHPVCRDKLMKFVSEEGGELKVPAAAATEASNPVAAAE